MKIKPPLLAAWALLLLALCAANALASLPPAGSIQPPIFETSQDLCWEGPPPDPLSEIADSLPLTANSPEKEDFDFQGENLVGSHNQGYGKFRVFDPAGAPRAISSYGWKWLFQGREHQSSLAAYDFRARTLWPELARWGQEDPVKSAPRLSLYQSFRGAPTRFGDPLGLYEEDVHHYLTRFLARSAGFSDLLAARIGFETQELDMGSRTAMPGEISIEQALSNMTQYHFLSPRQLIDRYRGTQEVIGLLGDDDLTWQRMGEYLHAWEDSYSHQRSHERRDFSTQYGLTFGHLFRGHEPDWTWKRPWIAWIMAKETFEKLKSFCTSYARRTRSSCESKSWTEIDDTVQRFILDKPPVWFGSVADYSAKIRILDDRFVLTPEELAKRATAKRRHLDNLQMAKERPTQLERYSIRR